MALTIDDILDKEFSLKDGGYDRDEVDQFLDEICDELTDLQQKIADLQSELGNAEAALTQAREESASAAEKAQQSAAEPEMPNLGSRLESMFRRAGMVADDTVKEAEEKADSIVKEAEEKASRILDDAMEEQETIRQSLNDLKNSANAYRQSVLEMLDKHRQALEDTAGVFEEKQEG